MKRKQWYLSGKREKECDPKKTLLLNCKGQRKKKFVISCSSFGVKVKKIKEPKK